MPLLLRGARQTGKTHLITMFGQKYFSNIVTINFELNLKLRSCFNNLDPASILQQLSIL
jgi:predicted AAA+ superfamily ATPase